MGAGDSAAREAARQRELADEHARRAGIARQMARSFEVAAHSEQRLARTLIELEPLGYTLLADRKRPGSARGNVDLVLVGPGGVVLVDAKAWREVTIAGGRVWRGADDATPEIERLADLLHRTQGELAEIGLAPGEVRAVVAFTGLAVPRTELFGVTLLADSAAVSEIARLGPRLSPTRVAGVRVALEQLFPPVTTGPVSLPVTSVPEPVLPFHVTDPPTAEHIHEALLEGLRRAPIEEWMAFLDPDQARLVRRSFGGPSRIRGAAGTGKTVVALHRAAYLARVTGGPVLVTTFVRTLPTVLESLLRRMAPDIVNRVEFRSVHGFAADVLDARGAQLDVDAELASRLFDEIWRRHGLTGPLGAIDPAARYWYEEVSAVLKGRGLSRFEQYAGLARHGRRRPLTVEQRAAVWELYVAYEAALRARGIADWQDLILEADASLKEQPLERYRAVIVDEVQDLSPVMIRLLHSLVGDIPDGLNLIGDGQQTIYPGGSTLAEAGVSIAGRSVVLRTNHRNTAEIAEFAGLFVRGDQHTDIEGATTPADEATTPRHGPRPVYTVFPSRAVHDRSLVERVRRIVSDAVESGREVRLGDIGVLALYAWHAKEAAEALAEAGIPTIDLATYDGTPTDAVKVGTIKRAKGLEFAEVLVVRTPPYLVQEGQATLDDAAAERTTLQRRELFVGMTRARDGLWVGVA
ncbi:UvrD-helicase domain-containing protein [Pseudolysinimonas sp.]|uniref:nuclease-related domain-containing DEAD/DEAH box helicase n=1 Tax=Pseudolysinimonas sp. TaxID=2680009 RepID=UPI00286B0FC3|nr:UvrD-helicase domain-containing protein [Pseudolysinimonas sp.]